MAAIEFSNPNTLGAPLGQYSQIAWAKGCSELLFVAGQVATNKGGEIVGDGDFDAQCTQVFHNVELALKSVGAGWKNVVQFTTYLVHSQDIPKLMIFRKREFPKMFGGTLYPPNTLLLIDRLVQEALLIEVQAIAAR